MLTLRIDQSVDRDGGHRVEVSLSGSGVPQRVAVHTDFAMSADDRERVRWYLEDFLEYPVEPAPTRASGVEARLVELGERLFTGVFGGADATRLWGRLQGQLPRTRVEIASEVEDATALPWELLRDPATGTPVALEAASFVRVNHGPARPVDPVTVQAADGGGGLRVLLVICRPAGRADVPFRSVASQLVRLGDQAQDVLDLHVLRPPTFARLEQVLSAASDAGRPFHVVHFDGHGTYLNTDDPPTGGAGSPYRYQGLNFVSPPRPGGHGYLLFEDPGHEDNQQLVDGPALGDVLQRTGVSVLVLNACRSAYAEAPTEPATDHASSDASSDVHARVRGYGSLALEVTDAGVPGVVAMRYSVYVVTAAQFVADLYTALLAGQPLGTAVAAGRRQLAAQPNRQIAFDPRPLQDWSVPVVYESMPLALFTPTTTGGLTIRLDEAGGMDDTAGVPRRPDVGFFGRDETLLALDRAFDSDRTVLLWAYAGAGKTSTAAEFARWYTATGGLHHPQLGDGPVLFSSLEHHIPLAKLLNQLGETFAPLLETVSWGALDQAQRRKVALQLLKQVPMLWIWDNVEPVAGFPAGIPSDWTAAEQRELVDFLRDLADTKAKVLLTSRRDEDDWLGSLPARVSLPPMPMRERIQLTQALAQRHGHRISDVADWRPLLRYTAGNPLTITVLVGQALKQNLTSRAQIVAFVSQLRAGETTLDDDAAQGRAKSLGASLSYGFQHAFTEPERAQLALLHLFQDTVDVNALVTMGRPDNPHALSQLAGLTRDTAIALLDRAGDIGLLTALGSGYYTIHPALPWYFTQLFAIHHGSPDTPTADAVQRAYTAAIGYLGNHYYRLYHEGRHNLIDNLAAEEANLLRARTIARTHGDWDDVIGCMQGLNVLYGHQGRGTEWARLVYELTPDLVDPTSDGPLPDRESHWSVFTDYRVHLADESRDWATAERLQTAQVSFTRDSAVDALAAHPDKLTPLQRNRIRSLAASLITLGRILYEQQRSDCITQFREAARLAQHIGDRRVESVVAFNLGHAYLDVPDLRDLDQAEHWYRRDLELTSEHDRLGRGRTTAQLGQVAHERFRDARAAGSPNQVLVDHLNAAATDYHEAVDLIPTDHPHDHAVINAVLGSIYADGDMLDTALGHYQQAIKNYEDTGDLYWAGTIRRNVAINLAKTTRFDEALLYARAALHDFTSLGSGAARDVEETQRLISGIERDRQQPTAPS